MKIFLLIFSMVSEEKDGTEVNNASSSDRSQINPSVIISGSCLVEMKYIFMKI
jgi:hypothetical protein